MNWIVLAALKTIYIYKHDLWVKLYDIEHFMIYDYHYTI